MRPLLACLLLVLPTLACDRFGGTDEDEAEAFHLLDAMLQIDIAYKEIEPRLRDREGVEETAEAARAILTWADDPTFEEFLESDRFYSDPERFQELRGALRAGAQRVLDGASGGDFDDVRQGFIDMKMSCIACHKRFSPAY